MRKTNQGNGNGFPREYYRPLAVDTEGLQTILSCGNKTAIEIGVDAQARIVVGRRVLWNVEKIQEYLNMVSTR